MTRELIVVSHTPFVLLQLQLFWLLNVAKSKATLSFYVVDNDDATDRRISTNIIHNGKI